MFNQYRQKMSPNDWYDGLYNPHTGVYVFQSGLTPPVIICLTIMNNQGEKIETQYVNNFLVTTVEKKRSPALRGKVFIV